MRDREDCQRESSSWLFALAVNQIALVLAKTERRVALQLLPFAFLEHILDRRFVDYDIRRAYAIYLDAVLVIPLNHAMNLFVVGHHDDHRRFRLHLLLVIKILGISLVRRRGLARAVRTLLGTLRTLPPL